MSFFPQYRTNTAELGKTRYFSKVNTNYDDSRGEGTGWDLGKKKEGSGERRNGKKREREREKPQIKLSERDTMEGEGTKCPSDASNDKLISGCVCVCVWVWVSKGIFSFFSSYFLFAFKV